MWEQFCAHIGVVQADCFKMVNTNSQITSHYSQDMKNSSIQFCSIHMLLIHCNSPLNVYLL